MSIDLTPPSCLFDILASNSNSKLSFPNGSGSVTQDPITGNFTPIASDNLEVTAILDFRKMPEDIQEQFSFGQDQKVFWVYGRCTNPTIFPTTIRHLSQGLATINNRTGRFILYNPHVNPYCSDTLGQEFYGVFLEGESA